MRRLFLFSMLTAAASACAHAPPAKTQTPEPPKTNAAVTKEAHTSFSAKTIDADLAAAWKSAGITPAAPADDATFLRRVYVDVVGTVPPADVTTKFLDDKSPDKRARLVDQLLASPEYAEHWMNYWDTVLMGQGGKANMVDRGAFRGWLKARFAANAPWDRIVSDLVSATGANSVNSGGKTKGPAMAQAPADEEDLATINGATNWTLKFEQQPQDIGGNAAKIFLGVQIQCAQCHDHKTEKWKQDDFRKFSAGFFRTRVVPLDTGDNKMKGLKRVELKDAAVPQPRFAKMGELGPIVNAKPTALDGTSLDKGADTRKAMAAWITAKENPWFAKAFVNRMWGHFLGRGFYDPVDDVRPSNPATATNILDEIAADFAAHDFDIKYLVRMLTATQAYQLSSGVAKTDPENKLWAKFHLVPLGPEELMNAIMRVSDLEEAAENAGVKDPDNLRADIVKQYAFLFDTDEESDAPDYSGTVSQALSLLNGALVGQGSRALPGATADDFANAPGPTAKNVDALAVRVLARHATPDEIAKWSAYIDSADARAKTQKGVSNKKPGAAGRLARMAGKRATITPKQSAYEDIVWSLLNSSEFTFNH